MERKLFFQGFLFGTEMINLNNSYFLIRWACCGIYEKCNFRRLQISVLRYFACGTHFGIRIKASFHIFFPPISFFPCTAHLQAT